MQHVCRLFRRGRGGAGQRDAGHRDQPGDRQRQADVAEYGDELGARHVLDQIGQPPQFTRVGFLDTGCDRGRGHRRLLGGDREAEQVDEHEAEAVVEAEGDALRERRKVQGGELDLRQGHEGDDDAAAGGA